MKSQSTRISLLSSLFLLLSLNLASQQILADSHIIPGRAWIRLHNTVRIDQNPAATLRLPAGARIEAPLLTPQQCIALNVEDLSALKSTFPVGSLASLELELLHTFSVSFDVHSDVHRFCHDIIALNPNIELALPVYRNRLQYSPNDQHLGIQTYLDRMHIQQAWDTTRGDSALIIAVSDAGMRRTHEDLRNAVSLNTHEIPNNGIDDDNNGYVDDYAGYNFAYKSDGGARDDVYNPSENHGTCVSGIIGATQNNALGISGVSGRCKLFPLKIDSNNDPGSLDFGYESIVYAAVRGASIVNCSWGNDKQGFNPMEQSVIDFAIARGTCVVVAAGNHNGHATTPFYPANYRHVLSVQEVDENYVITETSSYGAHSNISAPGANAVTTDNDADDSYTLSSTRRFGGTSSATPMVSGALALVRARFPALSAQQAMQHLRVTGRAIDSLNPTISGYVCRCANAQNAVNRDPYASPAIRISSFSLRNNSGRLIQHASVGDTVNVAFHLKNYLGGAEGLRFHLTALDPNGTNCVFVIDTILRMDLMHRDQEADLASFPVIITQANTQRIFLRLDITARSETGTTTYWDFDLIEFYATRDYITLSDNVLRFSIGDYGWIGSNQFTDGQRKGDGFSYASAGNLLYRGGIICTSTESKVRTGIGSDGSTINDFTVVSRSDPWPYVLTISDVNSADDSRLGVEIMQRWTINDRSLAICDITARNKGENSLSDFALGYFLDWDLSSLGDSCSVRRFTQAEHSGLACVAEIEERSSRNAVAGCMAMSTESDAQIQAAGLNSEFISGNFPSSQQFKALNSGTAIQASGIGDMSMVVGMKFSTPLSPGSERRLRLVMGAAPNADSLAKLMRDPLLVNVAENTNASAVAELWPMPVADNLDIRLWNESIQSVSVYSVSGQELYSRRYNDVMPQVHFDVNDLINGFYILKIHTTTQNIITRPLIVQH